MKNNMMNRLMKLIASTLFMTMAIVCFTSCNEEEKGSYPPAYYGFSYSPVPVHPGDSVTITAVQARKGHYLNACDYTLNVPLTLEQADGSLKDTTIVSKYHTNYDGTDNGNPTFKILIPANAIDEKPYVTFSARWNNSADGIGGEYSASGGTEYLGLIVSTSYLLYSSATGHFNLPIKQ